MHEEGKSTGRGKDSDEGPPPVFGSWRRLYAAVLVFLLAIIVFLLVFTLRYRGGPS